MRTPAEISDAVMDANYGAGSDWEEPNRYDESGFTRAQAESDIDRDEISGLIVQGVEKAREELRSALDGSAAVPGFREYPLATVDALLDAYRVFDGDENDFVSAWNDYTAGKNFPCPAADDGLHEVVDGVCQLCDDTNRS